MRYGVLIVLALAVGCNGGTSSNDALPDGPSVANLTTEALHDKHETAEGGRQFKGKKIQLKGLVERIQTNENGAYYMGFDVWNNNLPSVVCYIRPADSKIAAGLKKGDQVELMGVCRGSEPAKAALNGYQVFVDRCQILKSPTGR